MRHMDDGELVRYVDGELGPAEAGRWADHVAACARCSREIETIRTQSRRLTEWLIRADFEADLEPPSMHTGAAGFRRVSTTWLKAAAIVLLVAAPLAAFPGVRGWVVRQVGGDVETTAVEAATSPVIRFEPAPGSFTVRFQPGTRNAVLIVERTATRGAPEAVLRMDGTAEPVVAQRVLRFRDVGPATRLTLALPDPVTDVRVLVGETETRVTAQEIDAGRTLTLDG